MSRKHCTIICNDQPPPPEWGALGSIVVERLSHASQVSYPGPSVWKGSVYRIGSDQQVLPQSGGVRGGDCDAEPSYASNERD